MSPRERSGAAAKHRARYLGFVFSTTECGGAVLGTGGEEAYAAVPMEARASWRGWPAHYLEHVPEMMLAVLRKLQARGWSFARPGYLSQSWRQHDLAILGGDDAPLIPAPGWECNGAREETRILQTRVPGFVETVGRIERRFAAAKLPWALRMAPELKPKVKRVMFSGDWVCGMLSGNWRLSRSDALCNGLLDQRSKRLATAALRAANRTLDGRLQPRWFPEIIDSKGVLGPVRRTRQARWDPVTRLLEGWRVVAFLGDNQATAAGCGTADHRSIVVSLGTSGTVNRPCSMDATLRGRVLRFEYWEDRLLLLMLARCGSWYESFRNDCTAGRPHAELNDMAMQADLSAITRLRLPVRRPRSMKAASPWREIEGLGEKERIASVQVSIALDLIERTRIMLREVKQPAETVRRFVLTGGLVRAALVRHALAAGLRRLAPEAEVMTSERTGPLAHKTDALGALFNAIMAERNVDVATVVSRYCKLKPCERLYGRSGNALDRIVGGLL